FRGELNFDDLFDSLSSEFYRDADEESVDAIFPVEIGGARKNLFLVFEDGLDHFGDGGRRSVIGRAGLEMFDDFSAAVAGALDDPIESGSIHKFGDGNAG